MGATGGSRSGVGLEITAQAEGHVTNVLVSPAAAYGALEAAYLTLQIPLTKRDDAVLIVGNEGMKMRRQLGRIELRRAFDCGGTSGMPNAETYTITASIVSAVTAGNNGTAVITTVVDASAQNPSFSGAAVRCSSTGAFERAIAKEVTSKFEPGR